ncbi:telomere repeats-binding bouquet formation protein 1-like isoform X2 [Physella acuta]|uniref:telomere repeats-binding bouquet formation protein 1-like isoform X2 n=1 Tax=Physella acuta TaxID=109671 RepID=UPI0027DB76A1|nr:telomere repeats-binding bouquet formation protein 1-like isoform X2 [Physella acuta]
MLQTPSSSKKRTMNIRYAQTQRRTSTCPQPVHPTSTTCPGLQIPPSPALSEFDQALKMLANKKRKQHSNRSLIDCSETSGISSLMSDHTDNMSTLGLKGHSSHDKHRGSHYSNNSSPAQVIPSLSLHGIRTEPKTPRFKDSEIHNLKLSTPLCQVSQSKGRKKSLNDVHSVNSLCPGCKSGSDLNSRTLNIAIETSAYTCSYHRSLRQQEREFIKKIVQNKKPEAPYKEKSVRPCREDVYHFTSESEKSDVSVCPDVSLTSVRNALKKREHLIEHRRPRIAYSEKEIQNLIEGVSKMGTCWHQILCTYEFHPTRTAVDLKDKYKRLMTSEEIKSKHRRSQKPFSMCEIRRLKRGVKTFGYNWKAILAEGKFLPGRSSSDLRDKWRLINKAN